MYHEFCNSDPCRCHDQILTDNTCHDVLLKCIDDEDLKDNIRYILNVSGVLQIPDISKEPSWLRDFIKQQHQFASIINRCGPCKRPFRRLVGVMEQRPHWDYRF